MFKKIISAILTVTLILTLTNCNKSRTQTTDSLTSIEGKGELVVAMDVEMPGFFEFRDVDYGYQYDLLKAYADYRGVKLKIIAGKSPAACAKLLMSGEADMVATLTSSLSDEDIPYSVQVYNTSYVLLGAKGKVLPANQAGFASLTGSLNGRRLLVCSAFQNTKSYSTLLDSLPSSQIYVTSRNGFELMEELASGQTDFVICEISEAHIGAALTKGIEQIYTFDEEISLSTVISPYLEGETEKFGKWLQSYRQSSDYAMLNYLYFEKGIVSQFMGDALRTGGISVYDKLMKQICEKEGYDWRFIAAIAYNESRFNPDVVSRSGARGLMQVMPYVARQFDVEGDIMQPDVNVLLGVKILGSIEKSLKLRPGIPNSDRMKIILACYNAGIGHVIDARNLAVKYGANPDSYDDLAVYLRMKGSADVANESVVKHGRFNSGQTLAFVEGVMSKYNNYCLTASL